MSWEVGLKYCSQLKLAGLQDWRMPNIKELRSLSDDTREYPSVDTSVLSTLKAENYWSSTTESHQPRRAWYVDFRSGLVTYADKPMQQMVIAVRGGGVTEPKSRLKDDPDPRIFEVRPPRPKPDRGGGGG